LRATAWRATLIHPSYAWQATFPKPKACFGALHLIKRRRGSSQAMKES